MSFLCVLWYRSIYTWSLHVGLHGILIWIFNGYISLQGLAKSGTHYKVLFFLLWRTFMVHMILSHFNANIWYILLYWNVINLDCYIIRVINLRYGLLCHLAQCISSIWLTVFVIAYDEIVWKLFTQIIKSGVFLGF